MPRRSVPPEVWGYAPGLAFGLYKHGAKPEPKGAAQSHK